VSGLQALALGLGLVALALGLALLAGEARLLEQLALVLTKPVVFPMPAGFGPNSPSIASVNVVSKSCQETSPNVL